MTLSRSRDTQLSMAEHSVDVPGLLSTFIAFQRTQIIIIIIKMDNYCIAKQVSHMWNNHKSFFTNKCQ